MTASNGPNVLKVESKHQSGNPSIDLIQGNAISGKLKTSNPTNTKSAVVLPVATVLGEGELTKDQQRNIQIDQQTRHKNVRSSPSSAPASRKRHKRKKAVLFMNAKRRSNSNRGNVQAGIVGKRPASALASSTGQSDNHILTIAPSLDNQNQPLYHSGALMGRYLSSSIRRTKALRNGYREPPMSVMASSLGGITQKRRHVPVGLHGAQDAPPAAVRGISMVPSSSEVSSMRLHHEETNTQSRARSQANTSVSLSDLDKNPEEAKVMQKYIANLLFSKRSIERNKTSSRPNGTNTRHRKKNGFVGGKRRPQSAMGVVGRRGTSRNLTNNHLTPEERNLEGMVVTGGMETPPAGSLRTLQQELKRPASALAHTHTNGNGTLRGASSRQRPTSAMARSHHTHSTSSINPVPSSHANRSVQNYENYLKNARPKSFQEAYFENLIRKRTQQKLSDTYRTGAESPKKQQRREEERVRQLAFKDLMIEVPSAQAKSRTSNHSSQQGAIRRPQSAASRRSASSMGTLQRDHGSDPEFIIQPARIRPHSSMDNTHPASYDNIDNLSTVNTSPSGLNLALEMSKAFRESPIRRQRPQSAHQATNRRSNQLLSSQLLQPKVEPLRPASNTVVSKKQASQAPLAIDASARPSSTTDADSANLWTQNLSILKDAKTNDIDNDDSPDAPPTIISETPSKKPKLDTLTLPSTPEPSTYMLANPNTSITGISPSATPVWKKNEHDFCDGSSNGDDDANQPTDRSPLDFKSEVISLVAQMRDPATFTQAANSLLDLMIPSKEYSMAAKQNKILMELVMSKFLQISESDDPDILILLIKILAQMCHDSTQNRMIFKQHSGVRKVIDFLELFAQLSANRDYFVHFMKNTFQSDFTLQMDFRLGGGIEKLVSQIRESVFANPSNPAQVGIFIHSLISVIFHNSENLSCFIENDGIHAMLSFFESGVSVIHEYSGVCLASLAKENPPLKTVLAEMNAVQTYIRVLKRNPTEGVVRSCGHICAASAKNQELFVERKGLEVLYSVLSNWRTHSPGVLRRCLVTLSTVCKSNKMALNYVHRTNGYRPILNAMTGCEACRGVGALTVSVLVENHTKNQANFKTLIVPMLSYLQSIQRIDDHECELITNFSLCLRSLCLNHVKNVSILRKNTNTRAIMDLEKHLEPNSEPYFHLDMLTRMISTSSS